MYLLKPRTSQNQPKRHDTTSRNDLKPAKTTLKNCETTQSDPEFQHWRNLEFSTSLGFSNFKPKCPNLRISGKKYQLSNLSTKFCLHLISKVLISTDIVIQKLGAKCPNLSMWHQKVSTFESYQGNFGCTLIRMC